MKHTKLAAALSFVVACNAPVKEEQKRVVKTGSGESQSLTVSATGGSLELEGVTLRVPAGAIAPGTTLTITSSTDAPPEGVTLETPIYKFAPDGTQFLIPVEVSFPFAGNTEGAFVFWSNADGSHSPIPATFANGVATVLVTHFSDGFVGRTATSVSDIGLYADGVNRLSQAKIRPGTIVPLLLLGTTPLGLVPVTSAATVTVDKTTVVNAEVVALGGFSAVQLEAKSLGTATISVVSSGTTTTLALTVSDEGAALVDASPRPLQLLVGSKGDVTYDAASLARLKSIASCGCSLGDSSKGTVQGTTSGCAVTATSAGTTSLRFTCEVAGVVRGRIVNPVVITAPTPTLNTIVILSSSMGNQTQYSATGSYSDNSSRGITTAVTWTSSDPSVATIGEHTGLAIGLKTGSTTITATLGSVSRSVTLMFTEPAEMFTLEVQCKPGAQPNGPLYCLPSTVGYSVRCAALKTGSTTTNVSDSVTWSAVGASGTVGSTLLEFATATTGSVDIGIVGTTSGIAAIVATLDGVSSPADGVLEQSQAVISWAPVTVSGLQITGSAPVFTTAELPVQAQVNASFSEGSGCQAGQSGPGPIPSRDVSYLPGVVWASENVMIAADPVRGLVIPLRDGGTRITASFAGSAAETTVLVGDFSLLLAEQEGVVPANPILFGTSRGYDAHAQFADPPVYSVSEFVSLNISNPAFAQYPGLLRLVGPSAVTGTNLTASLHGVTSNSVVLNTTDALYLDNSLSVTAPPACLVPGQTFFVDASINFDLDGPGGNDPLSQLVTYDVEWSASGVAAFAATSPVIAFAIPLGAASGATGSLTADFAGDTQTVDVTVSNACP